MISREYLEYLHLSFDHIKKVRNTTAHLATGFAVGADKQEQDEQQSYMPLAISASYFRRAGAHSLLLGEYGGRDGELSAEYLFSKAASVYSHLKMPYALFISAFAPNSTVFGRSFERWIYDESLKHSPQAIYVLLAMASSPAPAPPRETKIAYTIRRELEVYRSQPLGLLGSAFGMYLDVVDALSEETRLKSIGIDEAVLPFLAAYDGALKQGMHNGYHWSRLAMPFHPVEPDIFAALLIINRVTKRLEGGTILDMIEDLPLGMICKKLLRGILSDYDEGESKTFST